MDTSSLGDRMKGYESISNFKLTRRTPVIIRLDGKAFHTWTKQLKSIDSALEHEPYGNEMHRLMNLEGVNWNNIATRKKRGFCYTEAGYDNEIPIFTKDREYIERYLFADKK